jgi:hypothetical protein
MNGSWNSTRAIVLASLFLALSAGMGAQAGNGSASSASGTGSTAQAQSDESGKAQAGATPVNGDAQAPGKDHSKDQGKDQKRDQAKGKDSKDSKPAAGTEPVKGDVAPTAVNPDKVVEVGSQPVKVKPGSTEDVNAVGNRDIGGRGMGNWYSTDTEIKMGRTYADQIEKSTRLITDPVVVEYVNRIGQNIVKNSDCKVPFTIKVIDSD